MRLVGSVGWGQWRWRAAFDVLFGHLAFDDAGVGAEASERVEAAAEHDDGVPPAVVSSLTGEDRAPG